MAVKEKRPASQQFSNWKDVARHFAQPTGNDVNPVADVTDLSIMFGNDVFMWDQLAPVQTVDRPTGTYFTYTRDFWMRAVQEAGGVKRAAGSEYKRVGYEVANATHETIEYGVEKDTDRSIIARSQTPESLIEQDARFVANAINLELEKLVASTLFTTGIWDNDVVPGTKWDNASGTPVNDIDAGKETILAATGRIPNVLFCGFEAWNSLKENSQMLDKYKHTQVGVLTEDLVAAALGLERVVVGRAAENTAAEGATFSGSQIWGDDALLAVVNPPGSSVATAAVTHIWDEDGNVPFKVETYDWESTRSLRTRARTHVDVNLVAATYGYFLNNVST